MNWRSTYNNDDQVLEKACDFLRTMTHLTHLSGLADNLKRYVLDGNQTNMLRRLADACPTLTFVELCTSSRNAPSGWVTIERRMDDGRYAGWNSVKSLRGMQIEDWIRPFEPSASNSNWDKRIVIFKNSRRGGPGQRLINFCRPNLFLGLIFVGLCAAIVTLFLVQGYCSLFGAIPGHCLKPHRSLPYLTSLRNDPIIYPTS